MSSWTLRAGQREASHRRRGVALSPLNSLPKKPTAPTPSAPSFGRSSAKRDEG